MPKSGEQPSESRRRSGTDRRARGVAGRGGRPAGAGREEREGVDSGESGFRNGKSAPVRPMIELDFLRALVAVVDESGIDSLEITRAGTRIRISKTPTPVVAAGAAAVPGAITQAPIAVPPVAAPVAAPAAPAAAAPAEAAPAAEPAAAPAPGPELVEVKSPMVGTFYAAPAPEAPPYVEVGSTVTKGQTLCILEAMKLMNELESEVDGVIREILVENAEPVEYGQVLFRIEPRS